MSEFAFYATCDIPLPYKNHIDVIYYFTDKFVESIIFEKRRNADKKYSNTVEIALTLFYNTRSK